MLHRTSLQRVAVAAALVLASSSFFSSTRSASAMNIVIHAEAGLQPNSQALADFQAAAATWDSLFSDPITITIDANLTSTGFASTNIIGQTSPSEDLDTYSNVRTAMIADAAKDPNDAIVGFLPATLQANLPAGRTLGTSIQLTTANAKALGLTAVYDSTTNPNSYDATITFNSQFDFSYNRSTMTSTQIDFQTVATHEIAHALGFDSAVDDVDETTASQLATINATTLDLFRFDTASAPTTAAQFSADKRELTPGASSVTSDTVNAYGMSTGANSRDGQQASHWKDDGSPNGGPLNSNYIGIMDPTLPTGVVEPVTAADIRALDLIGYDVSVPEPATLSIALLGGAALLVRRRSAC